MFKYYTTFDIISEINVQILRSEHSIQILVDKNDIFFLSNSLLELLNKNIEVKIIIVSNNNNKSLKIINLVKRLIDGGFSIYWYNNSISHSDDEYFGIFDKTFLITKPNNNFKKENAAEVIRDKNSFFKSILLESEKLELLSGEINIEFSASNTIIQKNEPVELRWNIKNAYHVSIEPLVGDVPLKGSTIINLKNNETFTIKAINKETSISKILFIKVLENKDIDFNISVFDDALNQYIKIESSLLNEGNYGVYFGQTVRISWDIKMIGKFHENTLGVLPLTGFHELKIFENTMLFFTFNTIEDTQIKKIIFHSFDESQMNEINIPISQDLLNYSEKTNYLSKIITFIKKFIISMFKKKRNR